MDWSVAYSRAKLLYDIGAYETDGGARGDDHDRRVERAKLRSMSPGRAGTRATVPSISPDGVGTRAMHRSESSGRHNALVNFVSITEAFQAYLDTVEKLRAQYRKNRSYLMESEIVSQWAVLHYSYSVLSSCFRLWMHSRTAKKEARCREFRMMNSTVLHWKNRQLGEAWNAWRDLSWRDAWRTGPAVVPALAGATVAALQERVASLEAVLGERDVRLAELEEELDGKDFLAQRLSEVKRELIASESLVEMYRAGSSSQWSVEEAPGPRVAESCGLGEAAVEGALDREEELEHLFQALQLNSPPGTVDREVLLGLQSQLSLQGRSWPIAQHERLFQGMPQSSCSYMEQAEFVLHFAQVFEMESNIRFMQHLTRLMAGVAALKANEAAELKVKLKQNNMVYRSQAWSRGPSATS